MMTVRTSPHIHGSLRTDKAMLMVVIALLPAALWGVWSFGLRALFVLIVSIAGALLTEYLLGKVSKEFTLRDGSALVTGLLVGMNMPPLEFHQFYIPLIASAFAIGVVKPLQAVSSCSSRSRLRCRHSALRAYSFPMQ